MVNYVVGVVRSMTEPVESEYVMEVVLGQYRVNMSQNGLFLKHPLGIEFHLGVEETLKLSTFLNAYQETLDSLLNLDQYTTHYLQDPCVDYAASHCNSSRSVTRKLSKKKVTRRPLQ
jgi:hypothetical protein